MSRDGIPEGTSIRSKGFTLKSALAFVESRYGETGLGRGFEEVDSQSHAILAGPPIASTWYPFRIQVGLYEAIDRALGDGDLDGAEACRYLGRWRP